MQHAYAAVQHYLEPIDVHKAARAQGVGIGLGMGLSLLLALAHALNLYFFLTGALAPMFALAVHCVLLVITAVLARMMIARGLDSRFLMVLLIGTAFFGVLGALGAIASILLYFFYQRRAQSFRDWFRSIFPGKPLTAPEQAYEDIVMGRDESGRDYSVIPFMDVMEAGTEPQKREVLSKMLVRFHPKFAPAFRYALVDESNAIRVQAATAVSRIENQFLARLLKLTDLYRRYGNDPMVVLALAEHYDDYAFTGILDGDRERTNREKALQYYLEYLRIRPEDEPTRMHVGRLLLRMGHYDRASDWLRDSVNLGYHGDDLLVWYAEALYLARRYQELRALAKQHAHLGQSLRAAQPSLAESLILWSGQNATASSQGAAA